MSDSEREKPVASRRSLDDLVPNDSLDEAQAAEPGTGDLHHASAADVQEYGSPATELAELRARLETANEQYLRSQAELENFRKRMRRDMAEEIRYAAVPLMRELLSVVDNMQRAISAAEQAEGSQGLLEGVKMVADQFIRVLDQHGCKRIDAIGSNFDPNRHEAIGQEPSDEYAANEVTREIRAGYQLHDRVIRPSQVFISTGRSSPDAVDAGQDAVDNPTQVKEA